MDGDVSCLLVGVAVVPGAYASETERVCHGGFESLGHVHQSQLALGPQRRLGVAILIKNSNLKYELYKKIHFWNF